MMSLVSLANAKQFSCAADTTLLDAAKAQGLVLEHSCRTGRCGACKARVIQGNTRILKAEESLDTDELDENYILTCCRSAVDDLALDIEDLGLLAAIKTQTLPCKIDSLNLLAPDVMQIILRLAPNNRVDYLPGQYLDVIAKNGIRRSYSIANAPREDGKLELHVRAVENGVMSHYWFNEAKANDLLRLDGPHGTFCFHPKAEKKILLLATGTGIAPIKSMLEAFERDHASLAAKNIYIYWGGRVPADFYWQPTFANLQVEFCPTLSRADTGWNGRYGYVQDVVLADNLDVRDAVVYACGSDKMIHSAKKLLIANGLAPNNFYSDAFVSS